MLLPGDILFVPPLWFHHVTALTPSISVSVWSHYKASTRFESLLKQARLPLLRKW